MDSVRQRRTFPALSLLRLKGEVRRRIADLVYYAAIAVFRAMECAFHTRTTRLQSG